MIKNSLKFILGIGLISSTIFAAEISEEKRAKIAKIGKAASSTLSNTLIGKMKKQMKTKDKIAMVNFCQEQAEEITKGVNELLPEGIKVRRSTKNYRNPLNKPNDVDLLAIEHFENLVKENQSLKRVHKIIKTKTGCNYYRPIIVQQKCMTCHTSQDKMDPNIKAAIAKLFPNDKAHGYKKGDLRGVFVVEIQKGVCKIK